VIINFNFKYEGKNQNHKWNINKANKENWLNFKQLAEQEFNHKLTEADVQNNFKEYLNKLKFVLEKNNPLSKKIK